MWFTLVDYLLTKETYLFVYLSSVVINIYWILKCTISITIYSASSTICTGYLAIKNMTLYYTVIKPVHAMGRIHITHGQIF